MNTPLRVGLTGGIASGKSTVAERFVELGVSVIDADVAARRVVDKNSIGLARVIERFGTGVLRTDGTIDRAALRSLVFSAPSARRDLETILHPLIRARMDAEACTVKAPYLILAIPLLIESSEERQRVDRVLVVDVPESIQVARILARDGGTDIQAHAILGSQATRAARLAAADDVIENMGSVTALRKQVDCLHARYTLWAQTNRKGAI